MIIKRPILYINPIETELFKCMFTKNKSQAYKNQHRKYFDSGKNDTIIILRFDELIVFSFCYCPAAVVACCDSNP